MKNIPPSSLPTFYGKNNEYPEKNLFEFHILYRCYNYIKDSHILKLFLTTLKDSSLRWFMGLGESSIMTLEDMKTTFLRKYQEYCKPRDSWNDIFKIQQLKDERLEDSLEIIIYILHKSKHNGLQEDAVRTLFLKGISEDLVENLNLMASDDISHKNFVQIGEMCRNYSRRRGKVRKNI